jgi:hypothetical protein
VVEVVATRTARKQRRQMDGVDWLKAEPGEAAYPLEP